ncbi:sulfatase family protein [Marinilabilia rubra]|uniref:sulfatase family protein n=1 Tax=Marinilabilia rubra TaxID=2162893 RepID=UPI0018E07EA8|nr:sulfatase-like hydrolase/transferase [Marinilabilia rubra]
MIKQKKFCFSSLLIAFLLLAMLVGCHQEKSAGASSPNVIIIYTDDMGYGDVSSFGGDLLPTPNIDKLAEEGLKLTNFYVASPICSPSRAGLLTGMEPARWNITSFLHTKKANREREMVNYLDPNAPSMGRLFKNAGYATAHFGKWHLGGGRDVDNAPMITEYGFDEYSSTWESPDPDPLLTAKDWIWSPEDSIKRWNRTACFVTKTLDFLEENKDKPCFVNLWPDDVHTPWVASSDDYSAPRTTKWSYENLKLVMQEYDNQMGRLIEGIEQLGIVDNTLIIFTSDNGPELVDHADRAHGMRGMKWSLYEAGIRMPFIIKYPGVVPKNTVDSMSVVSALDLFPSLANLLQLEIPKDYESSGEDRSEVFKGKPSTREKSLFWEYGRNNTRFFKYPEGANRSPNLAMRIGKWKVLINDDGTRLELFDLFEDPGETVNLKDQYPDLAGQMKKELLTWRKELPELE